MRYLLCLMLLTVLVGCDERSGSSGAGATPETPRQDHDRVGHFKGEASEDWAAAIANLREYNQKLRAVLEQDEISNRDLADIHRWSYTLENAVGRLQTDLEMIADHLEEVHLASEQGDAERIREHGRKYLEGLTPLLGDEIRSSDD
jgi:hypothetical protein